MALFRLETFSNFLDMERGKRSNPAVVVQVTEDPIWYFIG